MVGSVTRADDATQNWQQVACALEGHQLEAGYAEALGHDAAWDGELPQAISAVDAPEPAETAPAHGHCAHAGEGDDRVDGDLAGAQLSRDALTVPCREDRGAQRIVGVVGLLGNGADGDGRSEGLLAYG